MNPDTEYSAQPFHSDYTFRITATRHDLETSYLLNDAQYRLYAGGKDALIEMICRDLDKKLDLGPTQK